MKQKKTKPTEDLVAHFQKRCMERIGHLVKQRTLKEGMTNGFLRRLGHGPKGRSNWKMDLQTGSYVVVYDQRWQTFVTVMYYEEWMANRRPDLKFHIKHPEYLKEREDKEDGVRSPEEDS